MNTISERLKEERKRLGFNQEDFACVAGITRRPYAAWEAGDTSPTAVQLAALAAAGADVRYIVTGERDGPAPEVLSSDERELLALFRAAPLAVKAAAIGALQGAAAKTTKKTKGNMVFHGEVGSFVSADTVHQPNLSITVGSRKK